MRNAWFYWVQRSLDGSRESFMLRFRRFTEWRMPYARPSGSWCLVGMALG